ncbi:uncharacterized protein Z518_07432 [Rhinocladiella mackenziei CBS 650.93]|uniref:SP-RING-type domain-containing protein n=1 Tax=Rhinocladiella mackenziei CBS 650.93 TaxID=1442369 RepID=A0A0D2IDH8_9EURO|nr:uncharacterized protein Z518_07432 [Rhinocladiella mackenziei CBS 650.93]KIX03879.1 hypothetical protein Z518_07432 [Rhinocladiella mackenziei CBS 650.93]
MSTTDFEPQPLSQPLNDKALSSLQDLIHENRQDQKLHDRLALAVQHLTDVTGVLNDRGYERKVKYAKEHARREEYHEEEDDEAARAHQAFQAKVESLTKKMDVSIRAIIDDQIWLEDLPDILRHTVNKAQNPTLSQQTEHNQSPTPIHSTRQSNGDGDMDADGDATELDESNRDQKPIFPSIVNPADTPHMLLVEALQKRSRDWASKSLTEKYAYNNSYKGFYRVLFDAKHPGESAPPMPNERLWFAAEEGREVISSQRQRPGSHEADDDGDEEDDEIEIASEKVRLKCPITLLPYVDPVTSARCNHSYEKTAIQEILQTTSDHVPWTPEQLAEFSRLDRHERSRRERQMRTPQVKCPECNVPLTAADLRPDPALKRRVQRVLAKARRNERDETATSDIEGDEVEDEDGEDAVRSGTQGRPLGLGSSPPLTSGRKNARDKAERVSSERNSTPSGSQHGLAARSRSRIVDVEDDLA